MRSQRCRAAASSKRPSVDCPVYGRHENRYDLLRDLQGNDLLDFYFADGSTTYRPIKVPLTAFDLEVLRTTAGGL